MQICGDWTARNRSQGRKKLGTGGDVDLGSGRFRDGGALYERRHGSRITSLVVARAQLAPALEFIRTAGLPFLIPGTVG